MSTDRLLIQILLLSLLGASLWVLAPFVSALLWAAVLAFASWPLMRLLTRWLSGRQTAAAAALTPGWMLRVAGPLTLLGRNSADVLRDLNALIHDLQNTGLPPAPEWLVALPLVGDWARETWSELDEQGAALFDAVRPHLGFLGNWLLGRSAQIAGGMI